MKMNTCGAQGL